jgi:hypothetical protein
LHLIKEPLAHQRLMGGLKQFAVVADEAAVERVLEHVVVTGLGEGAAAGDERGRFDATH